MIACSVKLPVKSYSTSKMKKSVFLLVVACYASSEKVLYLICMVLNEISPSPPTFEPVQLTLQIRIRLKYLSALCFNMLLSI